MRRRVVIFRHNLFEPSETFIRDQALAHVTYEPVFVARRPIHDNSLGLSAVAMGLGRVADAAYGVSARSRRLVAIVREFDPVVIHAHFGPDGLYVRHAARKLGIPLVVTLHGRDVTVARKELLRTHRPVALNYALRRGGDWPDTIFLCVSEEIRKAAAQAGLPRGQLRLSHLGVNTETLMAAPWPREPTVTHVARLVEKKGTEYLLRAFPAVLAAVPAARLRIFGTGPLEMSLRNLTHELGIGERVYFGGQVSPIVVRQEVGQSMVFALPSVTASNGDKEGLPVSILEAMSLATPVVGTRHSGIPEAVPPGAGLLVEERDITALADALSNLLSAPDEAEKFGLYAARHVRTHFSIGTKVEQLEAVYDSMARNGRA